MAFGEELHTGGKALESDILTKKIDFFKTLTEHVQIIGERIHMLGGLQASADIVMRTIPDNRTHFLFMISVEQRNNGTASSRNFSVRLNGNTIINRNVRGTSQDNEMIFFPSPLIIRSGEVLELHKNNTDLNHEVNVAMLGFEIPVEISIQ